MLRTRNVQPSLWESVLPEVLSAATGRAAVAAGGRTGEGVGHQQAEQVVSELLDHREHRSSGPTGICTVRFHYISVGTIDSVAGDGGFGRT